MVGKAEGVKYLYRRRDKCDFGTSFGVEPLGKGGRERHLTHCYAADGVKRCEVSALRIERRSSKKKNAKFGRSTGVEMMVEGRWRLSGVYTYLKDEIG